jgi:hypothetical protein
MSITFEIGYTVSLWYLLWLKEDTSKIEDRCLIETINSWPLLQLILSQASVVTILQPIENQPHRINNPGAEPLGMLAVA